ncbi:SRPBCC domain-containing protein [Catellatospora chokoriensis]|uniref:Activator of HSP90 ATPase n=1 Tax=Catellatospora chokoriensis TaxID=310353 RepID=A0A8J3K7F3_9ACTN|nr:SRPBCC domain-containing protein [Catellatospora chokoriensis]GIF91593.1 activator of HSP90 ATPase [Catellatospora chokoriensis]
MKDITEQLEAIRREVARRDGELGEMVAVLVRRTYQADVDDVWDAITSKERLPRWFAPVSGDFREGGSFQVENMASGEILQCRPPKLLRMTYGGPTSIVEVRLTSAGADSADLEVEHTVPIEMAGSGAGALYVGPGWDQGLLMLARYLGGEPSDDPLADQNSLAGQEFSRRSIQAWADAIRASGTATEDEITASVTAAATHFAPDL